MAEVTEGYEMAAKKALDILPGKIIFIATINHLFIILGIIFITMLKHL